MHLFQEAVVCSDPFKNSEQLMNVNLSNEHCFQGVKSLPDSWTNELKARDTVELLNWFRFEVAMTTVRLTYTRDKENEFPVPGRAGCLVTLSSLKLI